MTAHLEFELSDHRTEDEPRITRFEVQGIDGPLFMAAMEDEDNGFFDCIEEMESGEGPQCGTIDQSASGSQGWAEATWMISSCEIEDRRGFIDRIVSRIEEIHGWKLKEIP